METILQNSEAVNDNLSINEISEALSGFEVLIPGLRPFSLFPSFGSVPDKPELSETIDKAEDEAEPSKYTVADIFHLYWEDYIKENSATTQQLKTVDNRAYA